MSSLVLLITPPTALSLNLASSFGSTCSLLAPPFSFPTLKALAPFSSLGANGATRLHRRRDIRAFVVDEVDDGGVNQLEIDEYEVEESENKEGFDPEYEPLVGPVDGVGEMVLQSKNFVQTQGWESETVVNYRINEDEFHKIQLFDCDFFIRKPPDPDNDVYDFREMYVTPPDTDVYSIPRILAPMPQKYIRCAKSDYGCHNVTEPPIDALRDPMYKCEREVWKIFLTKHYKNRRLKDPEFVLDFEEIYVIDSKTKSITRAKVLVTAAGGRDRDRKRDVLVIRDKGHSFKIIDMSDRDDPVSVIEKKEWDETREAMERHLKKLGDFNDSNWF